MAAPRIGQDPEEVRRQAEQDALEGLRRLNKMRPKKGPKGGAPTELAPPGSSNLDVAGVTYRLASAKKRKRRADIASIRQEMT